MGILDSIASKLGGRVRASQNYDENVCRFTVDATTHWKPVAVDGFPFSEELRISRGSRKIELAANPEYVRLMVKGKLPIGGMCSINKAGQVEPMEKSRLRVGDDPRWPVFIPSRSKPSSELEEFLHSPDFHRAIRDLLESEVESVHLFDGGITLYSKPSNPNQVLNYISVLSRLVGGEEENSLDLGALPVEFQDLAPLIRKWAESDDAERSALLDSSSPTALRRLVNAVAPRFEQINWYLDSFERKPMPEAATALGTLAEAASEAELRLKGK